MLCTYCSPQTDCRVAQAAKAEPACIPVLRNCCTWMYSMLSIMFIYSFIYLIDELLQWASRECKDNEGRSLEMFTGKALDSGVVGLLHTHTNTRPQIHKVNQRLVPSIHRPFVWPTMFRQETLQFTDISLHCPGCQWGLLWMLLFTKPKTWVRTDLIKFTQIKPEVVFFFAIL